jgi:hypothetical protein
VGISVTYGYDDNGNTLTKDDSVDVVTYGYDFENRLKSVDTSSGSVMEYGWDGENQV